MDTRRAFSMRIVAAAFAVLPWIGTGTASTPLAAQIVIASAEFAPAESVSPSDRVLVHRDRASRLTMSGQFGAAGREWARVARLQRAQGELPLEALRMQAEMYHIRGFSYAAASVLQKLAEEAGEGGSLYVSAQAYLEAAALYQQVQQRDKVGHCMEQVDQLLRSPHLDAEQRSSLESRIIRR